MDTSRQISAIELKHLVDSFFCGKNEDSQASVDELYAYLTRGGKNWLVPIDTAIEEYHGQLQATQDPFVQILDVFIATRRLSDKTKKQYRYQLEYFFVYLREREISQPREQDINAYLDYLTQKGWKDTSIRDYLAPVKKLFKWTQVERIYPNIAVDVSQKVDKGIRKKVLTAQQAYNILQNIDRSTTIGKRNYTIFFLVLLDGLRTIEVSRADVGDLQCVYNTDVLYVQGKGQNSKEKFVKLMPEVSRALHEYLEDRKDAKTDEPLFLSEGNRNTLNNQKNAGRMAAGSISRILKNEMKKAGVDDPMITPHSLRHTAATWSLVEGQSISEVQGFMRHENMNTVLNYVKTIDQINNTCSQTIMDHLKKGADS